MGLKPSLLVLFSSSCSIGLKVDSHLFESHSVCWAAGFTQITSW